METDCKRKYLKLSGLEPLIITPNPTLSMLEREPMLLVPKNFFD
jgi:hypothetical protein